MDWNAAIPASTLPGDFNDFKEISMVERFDVVSETILASRDWI